MNEMVAVLESFKNDLKARKIRKGSKKWNAEMERMTAEWFAKWDEIGTN